MKVFRTLALTAVSLAVGSSLAMVLSPRRGPEAVGASRCAQELELRAREAAATAPTDEGFVGVLLAEQAADLACGTEGRLLEVGARIGQPVSEGEILARLDDREARSKLAEAEAALDAARAQSRRAGAELADALARLARRTAVAAALSAEEVDTAAHQKRVSAARAAEASAAQHEQEAKVARLRLELERMFVRAPFAGAVAARYLDPGSRVQAQTAILRLVSAAQPYLRFAVPEERAGEVRAGVRVEASLEGLGRKVLATVSRVAPEIESSSRMIFAEARVEPDETTLGAPPAGALARIRVLPAAAARVGWTTDGSEASRP